MKIISLATISLLFPFTVLAGDPPTDCTDWDQEEFSHCTHYVDKLEDPSTEGYMMRLEPSVQTAGGDYSYPVIEFCQNSNSELTFFMDNEPGTYTMRYKVAYPEADGKLVYKDLATQTFVHTGTGPANPTIFTVVIPKTTPITCDPSESLEPFSESRRELNRIFQVK